ncbi:hypothetical protein HDU89_000122 [Geranomyces variabilis]|nr:hypothetical protein HDU89_000122 [Geranomyces variabilis]
MGNQTSLQNTSGKSRSGIIASATAPFARNNNNNNNNNTTGDSNSSNSSSGRRTSAHTTNAAPNYSSSLPATFPAAATAGALANRRQYPSASGTATVAADSTTSTRATHLVVPTTTTTAPAPTAAATTTTTTTTSTTPPTTTTTTTATATTTAPTTIPARPQLPLVHDSPFVGSPLMVSDNFEDRNQPAPRGSVPTFRSHGSTTPSHRRISSRASSAADDEWNASQNVAATRGGGGGTSVAPGDSHGPNGSTILDPKMNESEDDLSAVVGRMDLESDAPGPADSVKLGDKLGSITSPTSPDAAKPVSILTQGLNNNSGQSPQQQQQQQQQQQLHLHPSQQQRSSPNYHGLGQDRLDPPPEKSYKNTARIFHNFGPMAGGVTVRQAGPEGENGVIPIMISWAQGGGAVYVTGTFNNWKQKVRMSRSNADFTTVIDMPPGTHRFKFIVDDEWKCSEDLPIASDSEGNLVNYLEVTDEAGERQGDGLDELAKFGDAQMSPVVLSSTPPEAYTTEIPTPASLAALAPSMYSQQQQNSHHPNQPPHLPPHLEKVLLNSHALSKDDRSVLPVPNHVTLNHMYACSIRDGVMAVGCTTRYRMKYITTVLYKPVFQ